MAITQMLKNSIFTQVFALILNCEGGVLHIVYGTLAQAENVQLKYSEEVRNQ